MLNFKSIEKKLSQKRWRLIDSGAADSYFNMAADEYLMHFSKEEEIPTLRFYEWKPSGISVGYNQKVKLFLDVDYINSCGFQWVRRITGGETVFHHNDQTYSVAIPANMLPQPKTKSLYFFIHMMIAEALKRLDIDVDDLLPSNRNPNIKFYNCFVSKSDYELSWKRRKFVGSAQKRSKGVFLQHGAIMLDVDYFHLDRIFLKEGNLPIRGIEKLKENLCGLREICGEVIDRKRLKTEITRTFERYGIKFIKKPFSKEEIDEINLIKNSKYSLPEWNEEGIIRDKKEDG
ncbi:MAG: lipoate--protein ligase family protein [Candidatus Schekmanbacteria bacterium]|nr:MAG: lipoate--protein ligase family protein [Candidatus Schekmanbacteria bacterium]